MDSSIVKFHILALNIFRLLASSPFGLCENADRTRITPSHGCYKHLRLLQFESTTPDNSFPYGIYTSPPLLSGAVPPISPNSPPVGISTPPPTSVPPSPEKSSPYGTFNPPLTPSGAMSTPLLPTSPPPSPLSPSAQTPQHNAPMPPAVNQPPTNNSHSSSPPPPPPKKAENVVWCVAKPTVPADLIQQALDYACGSGAGCDVIQPNGACYQPATLLSHASYAFNSCWQKKKQGGGTCDFGGTAMLVTVDPSYDQCRFTYN
ncbi:Glucan endo-1,3-beta-glucosidase 4 [Capsicum chinense]|nr:Glucan endo-1,3-beta-glucosidase 4 [Capsicum chinense]